MFHIILDGSGFIVLEDKDPIPLGQGDLILMPHGHTHSLYSDPALKPAKFTEMMVGNPPRKPDIIKSGGGGEVTTIACGHLAFDHTHIHPLLSALPALIHIKGGGNEAQQWLETTSRLISHELRTERIGSTALLNRLGGVLFIQVVRAYIEQLPPHQAGWLGALRDRRIASALELIHENPAKPWTIDIFARSAGMSRSAFASRFKTLVGETPMNYLTRWRMHLAANQLSANGLTVQNVAWSVGYRSSATFAKAFKRYIGVAPATYRRSGSEISPLQRNAQPHPQSVIR